MSLSGFSDNWISFHIQNKSYFGSEFVQQILVDFCTRFHGPQLQLYTNTCQVEICWFIVILLMAASSYISEEFTYWLLASLNSFGSLVGPIDNLSAAVGGICWRGHFLNLYSDENAVFQILWRLDREVSCFMRHEVERNQVMKSKLKCYGNSEGSRDLFSLGGLGPEHTSKHHVCLFSAAAEQE